MGHGFGLGCKEHPESVCKVVEIARFALPDYEHIPAEVSQLLRDAAVSFDVPLSFLRPEFSTGSGHDLAIGAVMHVPEAAVHEDDFFQPWKHEVWLAWQVLAMEAEAEAQSVSQGADDQFR